MTIKAYLSFIISLCLLAITITSAWSSSFPGDSATEVAQRQSLFTWVEYKFPDLFPRSIVTEEPLLIYDNAYLDLRSWSGAWGTRYLGIDDEGRIFGLGDYTNGEVTSFGYFDDWQDQIISDEDAVNASMYANSPAIVWDYTTGTFMDAPEVDYTQSSIETKGVLKHTNYWETFEADPYTVIPSDIAILDYNGDGILDAVTGNSDYSESWAGEYQTDDARRDILFFMGNEDGTLELDTSINLGLGPNHGHKSLIGDYNQDGYPDIFIASSGLDHAPWPGENQICLMSDGLGGYTKVVYENTPLGVQYHAATSVDIDSDGDLDVYIAGPDFYRYNEGTVEIIFENVNGELIPTHAPEQYDIPSEVYPISASFIDLDGDGTLEFIVGTTDEDRGDGSQVFGYVQDSNGEQYPIPTMLNYGVELDQAFYDIDNDGIKEIILARTGTDIAEQGKYFGYAIQILKYTSGVGLTEYNDIITNNIDPTSMHISRIKVVDSDNDGNIEIICNNGQLFIGWEFTDGKFEPAPMVKVQ